MRHSLTTASMLLLAAATVAAAAEAETTFFNPSDVASSHQLCIQNKKSIAKRAKFDTKNVAVPGRQNIMPKFLGGETVADGELRMYITRVLVLVVPGVLFALINMCTGCCCCCCRGPCAVVCHRQKYCRVCHCIPSTSHYTSEEVCMPVFVWVIFSLMLFGFAVAGIVNGTHKFNDSVVGGVCLVDDTHLKFDTFLTNVLSPLKILNDNFQEASTKLASATVVNASLSQNVKDLESSFGDMATAAGTAKDATSNSNCKSLWQNIKDTSEKAAESARESGDALDQTLRELQANIDSSIVQQSDAASQTIDSAIESMDTLKDQVATLLNPQSYGLFNFATLVHSNRDNVAFSAYGWIFLTTIITGCGLTGMHFFRVHTTLVQPPKNNPKLPLQVLKLNKTGACGSRFVSVGWACVFLFGVFSAVFAALTMPISSFMGDVCEVLPGLPRKLGSLTNMTMVEQITDTCWNETGNLFTGMNINRDVDISSISFESFNEAFGNDSVTIEGGNQLDEVQRILDSMSTGCGDKTAVEDALDDTRAKKKKAEDAFADNSAIKTIKEIGKSLVSAVDNAILGFIAATNCYFVREIWEATSFMICSSLLGSVAWWSASELFIAIVAMPFAITTMFVSKRYGGHGPIAQKGAVYEPPTGQEGLAENKSMYVQVSVTTSAPGVEMISAAAGGTIVTVASGDKAEGTAVAPDPQGAVAGNNQLLTQASNYTANEYVSTANIESSQLTKIQSVNAVETTVDQMDEVQGQLLGTINASDYQASDNEYIPPVEPPAVQQPLESTTAELNTVDGAEAQVVEGEDTAGEII